MSENNMPQPEDRTPETKSSQQLLLLVLLLLVALFGYLYFFTGLIRPRPQAPPPPPAQNVEKKPLPPRQGQVDTSKKEEKGSSKTSGPEANKAKEPTPIAAKDEKEVKSADKIAKPAAPHEEKVEKAAHVAVIEDKAKADKAKAEKAKADKAKADKAKADKVAKPAVAHEEKVKAAKVAAVKDEQGKTAAGKEEKGAKAIANEEKGAKAQGKNDKATKAHAKDDKGAKVAAKEEKSTKGAPADAKGKGKVPAEKEVKSAATAKGQAPVKTAKVAVSADSVKAAEGKKPVAGKAAVQKRGGYTLELAADLVEGEMGPVTAKLKKAGITNIEKTKVKKGEQMHRLFLADFANHDEATEELQRLKETAPDAFMLNENGRYAVYAGSYLREKKAALEQDRLYDKGVKLMLRNANAPVAVLKVRAGSFSDEASAHQAAQHLKQAGLETKVVRTGKQPTP